MTPTAARQALANAMSEADWQAQVVETARQAGWLCYHTADSRRSYPGFPDLVLVRGAVCIFLELKTERGTVTVAQQEWIDKLQKVVIVKAEVARPHHWDDVQRALTGAPR